MKTNFFHQIAKLNVPGNWKITIQTADNINFAVSALFSANQCGDNAAKAIPPMTFSGTADELGEGYFDTIAKPVEITAGLYHNMEQYLKEVEQARLNSRAEQDKKKALTTTTMPKNATGIETDDMKREKERKKAVYDDTMKIIEQLRAKMQYKEALDVLPSIADYPDRKLELEKKKSELENLVILKEKSLFA